MFFKSKKLSGTGFVRILMVHFVDFVGPTLDTIFSWSCYVQFQKIKLSKLPLRKLL